MQTPIVGGILFGAIFFLIGGLLGGSPLVAGLLGFVVGFSWSTNRRMTALKTETTEAIAEIRAELAASQAGQRPADPEEATQAVAPTPPSPPDTRETAQATQTPPVASAASSTPSTRPAEPPPAQTATPPSAPRTPRPPSALSGAISSVFGWFTSGNLFMKVGIVLLFLGVGFLLRYAAGQGYFTLEMRLAAIALASIVALVVGQRLLAKQRGYALMLQGAAIGVLYLDIFGAYSLYQLIPATLTFALLGVVSALAAALAVMHKAVSLAFIGFAGGFLAPILASSGSGNYVGLFSYYVVLDAAILAVAWFRSWRALNLLGFYFTFGVAALWGLDSYTPDKYANVQIFLVLFTLFFVGISILYARRQPPELKGVVDGSLLFGLPVIAFTMQLVLMQPYEYGDAWSAFAFGAFYIGLAAVLWRQRREGERLLAEVCLALGVIFTTLVIPFALGAADTSGAWALEGAGLVWIGLRQNNLLARFLGVVLQVAAMGFWLAHIPAAEQTMFINSSYLAGAMIAVAGFFTARLYREPPHKIEAMLSVIFVAVFVFAWYGIGYREIFLFANDEYVANWLVGYTVLSALIVFELARKWQWTLMAATSVFAPVSYVLGLGYLLFNSGQLPHEHLGIVWWPVALVGYGWILQRSEAITHRVLLSAGHVAWVLFLLVLVEWEMVWLGDEVLELSTSWLVAWCALPPLVALQIIHHASLWPIVDWAKTYTGIISAIIVAAVSLYVLVSLHLPGDSEPLPWVPLLNPLDLMTLMAVFVVYTACNDMSRLFPSMLSSGLQKVGLVLLGLSVFAWLNVTLFRGLHQWQGLTYDLDVMMNNSLAQTALSILWVTVGMGLVITATRIASRPIWIGGALLLAAVVVKLFVQDLSNTGSLERIVSFLGVGGMLVVIGYFSPLPPKKSGEEPDGSNSADGPTQQDPVRQS